MPIQAGLLEEGAVEALGEAGVPSCLQGCSAIPGGCSEARQMPWGAALHLRGWESERRKHSWKERL